MNLNNHWQQIMTSSPDGITITNPAGEVIFVSDKILDIIGVKTDEGVLGTNLMNWVHPDDREKAIFYIKAAAEELATSGATEYRMLRADKTLFYLESKGRVIKDKEGSILGMMYISRDITERKKLETSQLLQLKHESTEALAGGIAHDFNNILTAIKGQLSFIKMDSAISDDSKLSITEIENAIAQAKRMTGELLSLAIDGKPNKSIFSINKMLEETVSLVINNSSIKCNFKYPDSCFNVNADQGQINRVLSNLILNSEQAMPEGGEISFDMGLINGYRHKFLDEKKEYLFLSIADTGCGISKKNLPRIFDLYFSTKSKGTGLGLFSSFSIMQNHHGHLIAATEHGKGSVFTLYLPMN